MGPTTALALHAMLELGLPLHRVTPYTEGVQLQAKCQQAIAEACKAKPKPGEAVFINAGSASAVGEALDS